MPKPAPILGRDGYEIMPRCLRCGLPKKPWGRDSNNNGLCDRDCAGYHELPVPSRYWDTDEPPLPGDADRAEREK